jgi:hypothetical protein
MLPLRRAPKARIQVGLGHGWEAWCAGVQKAHLRSTIGSATRELRLRVQTGVGFARRGPGTSDVRSPFSSHCDLLVQETSVDNSPVAES